MKRFFIIIFSFFLISSSSFADDDNFINLAEIAKNLIPGEGDTEITISEQENYDIKYSILVVRPVAMNPLSIIESKHLYFTQVRFGNHEPFANNDERHLLNLGFGLRSLANNNNAIIRSICKL